MQLLIIVSNVVAAGQLDHGMFQAGRADCEDVVDAGKSVILIGIHLK